MEGLKTNSFKGMARLLFRRICSADETFAIRTTVGTHDML